jgi:aspartate racemase
MSKLRVAGVLGGMGPLATVDFLYQIIAATPAECDQDHIPLIVHQIPQIADRSRAILEGTDLPFMPMLEGLRRLSAAGCDFAMIPCNTAYHWYERLSNEQPLKILHIVDSVVTALRRRGVAAGSRTLAVLGTRGLHRSGIYRRRLRDLYTLAPGSESVQRLVDGAVQAVKAGQLERGTQLAEQAVRQSLESGAEIVLLACTELPLVLRDTPLMSACIDSTAALARLSIDESRCVAIP